MSPSQPAQISPKTACIVASQKRMLVIPWVRVSTLVKTAEPAKPIAAIAAGRMPGPIPSRQGWVMIRIPMKPSVTTVIRIRVKGSPSSGTAISMTQTGMVNSSAKTWASGATVIA